MNIKKRKIAINSITLFIRMCFITIITLFTSRIILQQLGPSDYGIYSVVAGVVAMIGFFIGSLSQGIQRFMNYYIATNDSEKVNQVYSTAFIILTLLMILIIIIAETIGLWFLNNKMNFLPERLYAANWVYQFSIISIIFSLFQIPHLALIMAHEDMKIYAIFGIIDAIIKIIIAFILYEATFDKLILYSVLLLIPSFLLTLGYYIYCKLTYNEVKINFHRNKDLYFSILNFSGWNIMGSSINVLSVTGINIVLNIFFGTLINAARAIAMQVSTCMDTIIQNVQVAMNPQIVQLYAKGEYEAMKHLILENSRWNFFLFWIVALPFSIDLYNILELWLGNVPHYTHVFTYIIIIRCLLKCIERPFIIASFAVGKLKWTNIITSLFLITEVIIAIILFNIGYPPYWCFLLDLLAIASCILYYMYFFHKQNLFSYRQFVNKVLLRILVITFSSYAIVYFITSNIISYGFIRLLVIIMLSTLISCCLIFLIGLSKSEREKIYIIIKERISFYIK